MKLLLALIITLSSSTYAESVYSTQLFQTWPQFSLQHEFAAEEVDLIAFEQTDFISLKAQAEQKNDPMIPGTKRRVFDEIFSLKNPNDIHYTVFMSATAGNRVSGFSQGFAMTTTLIEGELYLDAQFEHLNYNFENRYDDRQYGGDKYRVGTTLHWYPTDDFSLHLGIGGLVDK